MSAQLIYDTAPLGSLIRYSNGEPQPPERFIRKLKAWNNDNGIGRLVGRCPHKQFGSGYESPAGFFLELSRFGSQEFPIVVMRRHYSVDSHLRFEIAETPKPGAVRIVTRSGDQDELRHLAPDMAAAEDWMVRNRYSNMRAEIVTDPDPVILPSIIGRAA